MRTVCIIQARLESTRLPKKVLVDIAGKTMLAHVIERAAAIAGVDEVVVATTTDPQDVAVCREAEARGAKTFRGSLDDVLDRYYRAALESRADAVVRVTSDCPLLDPVVGARVVDSFRRERLDYCSNVIPASYPDGLSVEVVSFEALERSWREASRPSDREHVTTYIRTHLDSFRARNVAAAEDYSRLRWTVDHAEDLQAVRAIFRLLDAKPGEIPGWEVVLRLVAEHTEVAAFNAQYRRYEGWERSKSADPAGGAAG